MDEVEFNDCYNNIRNRILYFEGVVTLESPGCTIPFRGDGDGEDIQYDIYKMHIDEYTNHYSEDLYIGVGEEIQLYLFLYLKYGMLNLLHYYILGYFVWRLSLFHNDLMYQFITRIIDDEIDNLRELSNDPNNADSVALSNVIRFLENLNEDYIRERIDLLRDLFAVVYPRLNAYMDEYALRHNIDLRGVRNQERLVQLTHTHGYQSIIKQAYGELYHGNYFQTSGELITLCSYTSHNDLLILH